MKDYSIYKFYKGEKTNYFLEKSKEKGIKNSQELEMYSILWDIEKTFDVKFSIMTYNDWMLNLGEHRRYILGLNISETSIPKDEHKGLFLKAFLSLFFNSRGAEFKPYYKKSK